MSKKLDPFRKTKLKQGNRKSTLSQNKYKPSFGISKFEVIRNMMKICENFSHERIRPPFSYLLEAEKILYLPRAGYKACKTQLIDKMLIPLNRYLKQITGNKDFHLLYNREVSYEGTIGDRVKMNQIPEIQLCFRYFFDNFSKVFKYLTGLVTNVELLDKKSILSIGVNNTFNEIYKNKSNKEIEKKKAEQESRIRYYVYQYLLKICSNRFITI